MRNLQLCVDTFFRHLQLATLGDLHRLRRLVARLLLYILDRIDYVVALKNLPEHDMAAVEPRGDGGGDEELAAIGVFARVGHAEKPLLAVLELEVLIREFVAVDGLPARACQNCQCVVRLAPILRSRRAIAPCEVSALNHEVFNDTVEGRAFISEVFLARSQSTEVFCGL